MTWEARLSLLDPAKDDVGHQAQGEEEGVGRGEVQGGREADRRRFSFDYAARRGAGLRGGSPSDAREKIADAKAAEALRRAEEEADEVRLEGRELAAEVMDCSRNPTF